MISTKGAQMGDPESGNQILLEKKQWLSVEAQEQI